MFGDAPSEAEEILTNITRSAELALECVTGSLADYDSLHNEYEIFRDHLNGHPCDLKARKRIIEGLLRDLAPPAQMRSLSRCLEWIT